MEPQRISLMFQEPSLYLNGSPVCARPPNKIGEYAELGNVTAEQLEKDEEEFLGEVCGIRIFTISHHHHHHHHHYHHYHTITIITIITIITTTLPPSSISRQVKSRAESNGGKVQYLDVHKAELEVRNTKLQIQIQIHCPG